MDGPEPRLPCRHSAVDHVNILLCPSSVSALSVSGRLQRRLNWVVRVRFSTRSVVVDAIFRRVPLGTGMGWEQPSIDEFGFHPRLNVIFRILRSVQSTHARTSPLDHDAAPYGCNPGGENQPHSREFHSIGARAMGNGPRHPRFEFKILPCRKNKAEKNKTSRAVCSTSRPGG